MRKPGCNTALHQLIAQVRQTFPFDAPETMICGPQGDCLGCPKKLLEWVDSELSWWEVAMAQGEPVTLADLSKVKRLCSKVHRALLKNGLLTSD